MFAIAVLSACEGTAPPATATTGASDVATDSVTLDLGGNDLSEGDGAAEVSTLPDLPLDTTTDPPDAADVKPGDAPCGEAGCACTSNTTCNSGQCIDVDDHKECAALCSGSGCPNGFKCAPLTGPGGDITNLCVPLAPRICEPCSADSDCNTAVGGADSRCLPYKDGTGAMLGAFCGVACTNSGDCPGGYACQDKQSLGGVTSKQCVKSDLVCECDARAKKLGLSTTCSSINDAGSCQGKRSCGTVGLSACDAPAAVTESCNQIDDNCNGKTDEPTAGMCEDGNACTYDNCIGGECQHPTKGGDCDDGDACTAGDSCSGLKCAGTAIACDDKNPCTIDSCDKLKGCVAKSDEGAGCSDGSACTVGDTCKDSACQPGITTVCDDENPCTTDSCDSKTGCVFANNQLPCSDGDLCSLGDVCSGGACVAPDKLPCNDGNPCTDDSCDPKKGCQFANNTATCDDNNNCTTGDTCAGGVCKPAKPSPCDDGNPCTTENCDAQGGCTSTNNTAACDDGSICTVGDACASGTCQPGKASVCNDGNPCTDDSCDAKTGCVFANNTATCSDGNLCTAGDTCKDGACVSGSAAACDDGNLCTLDTCSAAQGCKNTPQTIACNDGNACTVGDSCKGGACVGGSGPTCNDGNPCTTDSCDADQGCTFVANTGACSDGNVCTESDACAGGFCVPGAAKACGDGNPCTDDTCNAKTGCENTANQLPCTDNNACTVADTCAGGTCTGSAGPACNDGNPCTDDTCDKLKGCVAVNNTGSCSDGNACSVGDACQGGVCVPGAAADCDDKNACTTDSCDPSTGCKSTKNSLPCDDGSVCSVGDTCGGGSCLPGAAVSCDDGNPCTEDSCDKQKGCLHKATVATCSDGNVCTEGDACQGTLCMPGAPKDCSDGKLCTTDSCDAMAGCAHADNTLPCDDGDVCSSGDVCKSGSCTPGATISCDDGNPCTDDSCDKGKGCAHANNTASCNDNNSCTVGDTCKAGVCTPSAPSDCDDKNPCTTETCDAAKGCQSANNTAPCSDGSVCTVTDVCAAGACKPGSALVCDDGNPCTDDACDKTQGCVHLANTATCTDGNVCTVGDTCAKSACLPGAAQKCNDGNVCTDDSCDPTEGCQTANNTAPCSDGSVCTVGDTCAAGVCKAGAAVTCNDGNVCTDDTCDASAGCKYTANTAPCNDNNGCTGADTCSAGKCAGTTGCASTALCTAGTSSVSCKCKTGYSGDGFTCGDVDECATGTATCPAHTDCSNNVGSYDCSCSSGYAECDGSVSNGCEVNTQTDAKNCGKCGAACSSTNIANPTCSSGTCNGTCAAGTFDCNNDKLSDGCEFKAPVPTAGTHTMTTSSITWKWNATSGATGYKFNTTNDYGTATATGGTSYTQSGLSANTAYTLYVWADYSCGTSLVATLSATTATSGYIIQPGCSSGSCSNMILVKATQQHTIGGSSYDGTWNNLNSICSVYGMRGPTTSSSATGLWAHSNNLSFPITSDQWNPTYPWMIGKMPNGFPGGRIWIASGDPNWLSKATYPAVAAGNNLYTNQGAIVWESYHPQNGGNWSQISSGTVQIGEYVMCAQ